MALKIAWAEIEVVFDPDGITAKEAIKAELREHVVVFDDVFERDLKSVQMIPYKWKRAIPWGTKDERTVEEIMEARE